MLAAFSTSGGMILMKRSRVSRHPDHAAYVQHRDRDRARFYFLPTDENRQGQVEGGSPVDVYFCGAVRTAASLCPSLIQEH